MIQTPIRILMRSDKNGLDNDCNGLIDDGTDAYDDDGDGYSESQGDCDDGDDTIHPNVIETENGRDDDCNGLIDDGTDAYDDDGDGYSEHEGDCDDDDMLSVPLSNNWSQPDCDYYPSPSICGAEQGDTACNFTLVDQDNNLVELYQFAGKVIVIDFFAAWCSACANTASSGQERMISL